MSLSGAPAPVRLAALLGGRQLVGATVRAAAAGAVTGLVVAYSYYQPTLRPLAHTFGLWILLTAAVSARQKARIAVLRASVALVVSFVAFFYGQQVVYQIKYSGAPYTVDVGSLRIAYVLALAAGSILGLLFAPIGRSDWLGCGATAAVVGLLLADVFRRLQSYPQDAQTLWTFATVAVLTVLVLTAVTVRQVVRVALLGVVVTVLGYYVALR